MKTPTQTDLFTLLGGFGAERGSVLIYKFSDAVRSIGRLAAFVAQASFHQVDRLLAAAV